MNEDKAKEVTEQELLVALDVVCQFVKEKGKLVAFIELDFDLEYYVLHFADGVTSDVTSNIKRGGMENE